ncbi:hypothetical protein A2U01_0081150, partial [Trifolium medium]|nr:hypothetical protein [Trifolium medium]
VQKGEELRVYGALRRSFKNQQYFSLAVARHAAWYGAARR